MTLGYPKTGDTERILKIEHKGIEIRTGNPEWGAGAILRKNLQEIKVLSHELRKKVSEIKSEK